MHTFIKGAEQKKEPKKWDAESLAKEVKAKPYYAGYSALIAAIKLASTSPSPLYEISEEAYILIADEVKSTPVRVQKNLRTLLKACCKKGGRQAYNRLIHVDSETAPEVLEFIDELAGILIRQREAEDKKHCNDIQEERHDDNF